jgi:hypothetical protein
MPLVCVSKCSCPSGLRPAAERFRAGLADCDRLLSASAQALRITTEDGSEIVTDRTLRSWTREQARAQRGRSLWFRYPGIDSETYDVGQQEILLLEDFSRSEQQLIRWLQKESYNPKFQRKNARRSYLEEMADSGTAVADAKKWAGAMLNKGVEFGAWRMVLKDAEFWRPSRVRTSTWRQTSKESFSKTTRTPKFTFTPSMFSTENSLSSTTEQSNFRELFLSILSLWRYARALASWSRVRES